METQEAVIEHNIERAKQSIALAESVRRLQKNRDFKKVFTETYFRDEVMRLVSLLGNYPAGERREAIQEELRAIANVQYFLNAVLTEGEKNEEFLVELEEEADLLRQEMLAAHNEA